MKKISLYITCMLLLLVIYGCASKRAAGAATADLMANEWVLVSLRADVHSDFVSPTLERMPVLRFDKADTYSGNDGCNGFQGDLTITGDAIHFAPGISTLRACLDIQGVDGLLRQVFEQTTHFSIEKNQLQLKKGTETLAVFKK